MSTTEAYQVDIFSIFTLIGCILVTVFLIVIAIYSYDMMNFKPPTPGESAFIFWTALILAMIFLILSIYALIKIFTYKSITNNEQQIVTQQVVTN